MADEMIEGLMDEDEAESSKKKFLLFKLGDEEYGMDIARVQGIEEVQKITPVPEMPDYVMGVVNLRGKVIPVIDLRTRFGMEFRPYDDRTCLIMTIVGKRTIGSLVDTVTIVSDVDEADIEPPPSFSDERKERFISGLAKIGDDVKILIDTDTLVQDAVLDKAVTE